MNSDNLIFVTTFTIVLLVCIVLLFIIFKFLRVRRVLNYSLIHKNGNSFWEHLFFDISDLLESLVIFNGIARTYDRFVEKDGVFRKGMDFITLKIIVGLCFLLFYLLSSFLYFHTSYFVIAILMFLFGFVVVDFYCIFHYRKRNLITRNMILEFVIIMNNGFKAGHSVTNVLKDVIDHSEMKLSNYFKGVLADYKMGFTLAEAFHSLYIKTGDSKILYISQQLKLYDQGVSYLLIFDHIEKSFIQNEKIEKELDDVREYNLFISFLFILIPIFFIMFVVLSNEYFIAMITSDYGFAIVLIELIIYLLYLLFIRTLLRGRYL